MNASKTTCHETLVRNCSHPSSVFRCLCRGFHGAIVTLRSVNGSSKTAGAFTMTVRDRLRRTPTRSPVLRRRHLVAALLFVSMSVALPQDAFADQLTDDFNSGTSC